MEKLYDVLISYDITAKNDSAVYNDIKECMIAKGYADQLIDIKSAEKKILYLPNTTLWKKDTTVFDAKQDLLACMEEYNVKNTVMHTVERCITLEFTSIWNGVYGTEHKSSSKSPDKKRS